MWAKCMMASVLGSIALAAPTAMRADEVIASNLGPGGSYSLLGGVAVDLLQDVAVPFAVKGGSNVSLTQIDIALTFIRSGFPATTDATVELLNDSLSGTPGTTVLGSWNLSNLPGFTVSSIQPSQTISGITGITLDAGGTYWLAAFGTRIDIIDAWDSASSNQSLGSAALSHNGGGTWFAVNGGNLAFDVLGTRVPEPSSLLLLGSWLLTFVGFARRRSS
jgi:hypothetical protein